MALLAQGITPIAALTAFRNHPRTFLEHNLVMVGDFLGAASGVVNNVYFQSSGYETAQRHGSIMGGRNLHSTQDFKFSPALDMGKPNVQIDVQFVQMYPFASIGTIQWHPLTGHGTPDIVITTKLTGCSFLVRQVGGNLECAHIQPNGIGNPPQSGQALRELLSGQHAGNYTSLYGRGRVGPKGYDHNEGSTVIGLRGGNNAWRIYAQRQVAGQATFKDVERIYPR